MEINLFSPHVDVNNHKFCFCKGPTKRICPLSFVYKYTMRNVIEGVSNIVPQEQA